MNRRRVLQTTAGLGTALTTGLAGCTLLSDPSDVATNEFGDRLDVLNVASRQSQVSTNLTAIEVELDLENTTTDKLNVGVLTEFSVDGDTRETDDYPETHAEYEIAGGETRTVREQKSIETDGEVNFEITLVDPADSFVAAPEVEFAFEFEYPEPGRFQVFHDGGKSLPMDPVSVTGPGLGEDCPTVTGTTTAGEELFPSGGCDYDAGQGEIRLEWTSPDTGLTKPLDSQDTL